MPRALGSFLFVFALLSLLVHLNGMFEILAIAGVVVFAVDRALARLVKNSDSHLLEREQRW